jgi:hypothetical protein
MNKQKLTITEDTSTEDLVANAKAVDDFLRVYKGKHEQALRQAAAAAETTATPFWASRYRESKKQLEETRAWLTAQAENIVARLRANGPTEGAADDTKELSKEIQAAAENLQQWELTYVFPFTGYAEAVSKAIEEPKAKARQQMADSPLTATPRLFESVAEIVSTWPKAVWNPEQGVLTIEAQVQNP